MNKKKVISAALIAITIVLLSICTKQKELESVVAPAYEQTERDSMSVVEEKGHEPEQDAEQDDEQPEIFLTPVEEQTVRDSFVVAVEEQNQQAEEHIIVEIPNIEMVYVEGGTFTRGSSDDPDYLRSGYERQVTVDGFYIGRYVVTQSQWVSIMGNNPSRFSGGGSYPVDNVSCIDALIFIDKLNEVTGKNFRLPNEDEWEFAARGGVHSQNYRYSGSNDINDVAWYDYNSRTPQPVGSKAPNELGIYDMSGNVWEWCSNRSGPDQAGRFFRVKRGGDWNNWEVNCRVYMRRVGFESRRLPGYGFRLAHSDDDENSF